MTFPGSNDDGDARLALELLGAEAVAVWHTATDAAAGNGRRRAARRLLVRRLPSLRCDRARRARHGRGPPLRRRRRAGARDLQRLPDPLRGRAAARACCAPNRQLEFVCADVAVTVESTATPFTAAVEPGDELVIPVKHGEGCWVADDELFADVVDRGQVVLRYADDVNGSRDRVAGVANEEGNVLGLMPHPEHAVDPLLGPTGGVPLLEGLLAAARERSLAAAL